MKILRAGPAQLDELAGLFDAYRVFYEQGSDLQGARSFLSARLEAGQSVAFLALNATGRPMGFTQLYPMFSSVSMAPFYVLNDLYVDPDFRGQGVGAALLQRAQAFAREEKQKGLALETATDNPAQALYERLGWEKNVDFFHYFWKTKELP